MSYTQNDIDRLLAILPDGKANAIHAYDIAKSLGYPTSGNQVETRALIRQAIQNGHIILSNTKSGYWISNDSDEVKEYIESLHGRAGDTELRSEELRKAWNDQNPEEQI